MNTSSSKAQQKNGKQNGKQSGLRRMIIKLSRKLTLIVTWRPRARVSQLLAMLLAATSTSALALPSGEQVVSGSISVARPDTASMTVTQTTDKGIINWNSYGIGAGEAVSYLQPSASSVTLNRVVGGDASQIFGQLSANGQIFLINPNGVLFAPGAQVDVGGLVASTLGIGDADFLAGSYTFQNSSGAGSVVNQGSLNGKYIALIAPNIDNTGNINASGGTAALAAGDRVSLDLSGDGLLQVSVDAAATGASIKHSGAIVADGGKVFITAKSADALMDTVLNVSGLVRAQSLSEVNGVIRLEGGNTGVVSVSGTLDASGNKLGETGGSIAVLGDKVGLFNGARLDASGYNGGGSVLVGGNYQGQGPEQNASMTYVAAGASIDASATTNGDGGTVIVWADDATRYYGSIAARGGADGGNGGLVETSGKATLSVAGFVDASAPHGRMGTWLLDPTNIEVKTGGETVVVNYADVDGFADLDVDSGGAVPDSTTNTIDPSLLNGLASVVLQATNDITFTNAVSLTTDGAGLTAQAGNSIVINAGITTTNGAVVLSANDPGGTPTGTGSVTGAGAISTGTAGLSVTTNNSTGGINLTGLLTVGGTASFATGAAAITLNSLALTGALSLNTTGATGHATVVNATALDLATSSVGGNLLATATTGNITDSGTLTVGGTAGFTTSAADADIDLGTLAITGALSLNTNGTTGHATVVNATAINLATSSVGGNLVATATLGNISDSGTVTVGGTAGFTTSAADADIDLGTLAVTGALSLNTNGATGHATVVNATALDLGASSVGGNLVLTAGGAITDSGNINVTGAATFNATGNITLGDAAETTNFGSLNAATSANNNIDISEDSAMVIGDVSTSGTGTVRLSSTGTLNDSDDIGTNITAQNVVTLIAPGGIGTTSQIQIGNIAHLALTTDGSFNVSVNGALFGLSMTLDPGTAANTYLLANGGLTSFSVVDLGTSLAVAINDSSLNLTVNTTGDLGFGATNIGTGNLLATATSGNITDSGTVTVGGTAGFTTSAANADIDLGTLAITGALSLNTNGATGNATVVNATALDLGASSVGGNLLTTATTGNITDSGTVTVGGTAGFTTSAANADIDLGTLAITGALSLNTNGATGNATVVNATALDLGASSVGGNLLTTATTGNITDSGTVTVGGTAGFTTSAANADIDLGTLAITGALSLNTNGATGNATVVNATALDLGASSVGGNLLATATTGNITDSGNISVTGSSTFTANTGGSSITLDSAGNVFTGSVEFASSGGLANVTIVDTTALILQALTLSGNLSVTAAGITDSGVLSIVGTTSLTAGSGNNITLDAANNFGGTVSVVSGNNVILNDTNAIGLGNITTTGDLTVTAVGNIDAYGTGGVLTIGGDLNATSTGGFGWFDYYTGSGHDYQGDVNISAATSVYVKDINNLELGRIQSTNSIVWIAADGKITGDTSLPGGCGVAGIFACGADIRVLPTQSIYLTSGNGGIGDGAFNGVSFDVASLQKAIHVDVVGASNTDVPSLIYLSAPEGSKTFLTVNTLAQTTSLTTPAPASGTGPIRVAIPQRDAGGNIIGTSTVPPTSGMNLCNLSTAQCINLFDLSEVAGSFDISGILNAAFQDAFNAQFGTDNIRVAIQNGFLTEFGVVPPGIDGIDGDGVNVPGASQALVIDTPPFLIDEEGLKRRSLPK